LSIFSIIDFLAVCAGALGGAAESARDDRQRFDIVGVVGLGLVAALGGGITRDVLLARGTPLALMDVRYLGFAFAGAFLGILLHRQFNRIAFPLVVIDAAALGLYAVAGSTRATDAGLGLLPALLLGAITAAGGGAWKDVFAGRTPRVLQPGQPYVLVALTASAVYLWSRYNLMDETWSTVAGCLTGFILRMAVVRFGWITSPIGSPANSIDEPRRKP
jgi:uncharacterized membrane protein YeiH